MTEYLDWIKPVATTTIDSEMEETAKWIDGVVTVLMVLEDGLVSLCTLIFLFKPVECC